MRGGFAQLRPELRSPEGAAVLNHEAAQHDPESNIVELPEHDFIVSAHIEARVSARNGQHAVRQVVDSIRDRLTFTVLTAPTNVKQVV